MLLPVAEYARIITAVMVRLGYSRKNNVETYVSDREATLILPTIINSGSDDAITILLRAKLEQAIGLEARTVLTSADAGVLHDILINDPQERQSHA